MTGLNLIIFSLWTALLSASAADTVYFPNGSERWYSKHLKAMKEPSLYEQRTDKSAEQYRFLWLRSFHKPIAVRIRRDDTAVSLRAVRLSGRGGYQPGRIEHDETLTLTTNQWHEFSQLLEKSSFWTLPTDEKNAPRGFDGSRWVLEGLSQGKYHVVDRWTPVDDDDKRQPGDFVVCCRYILKLSKQKVPEEEDY